MSEESHDHITPCAAPPVDVTSWEQAESPHERARAGIAARQAAPLESHAIWQVREGRREAISLLEEQSAIRVQELIPLRYKRMSANPFTFYRGTVLIMTNDLASTPVTGIPVQCVGDAHIGNFGMFRSPSARLVFDINDFDETAVGPWEWDIKRLAVSVEICGRANGIKTKDRRAAVMRCMRSYREHIRDYSEMDYLDAWYDHIDVTESLDRYESTQDGKRNRTLREAAMKAATKDNDAAAAKLAYRDGDRLRFRSDPPELVPLHELTEYADRDALQQRITGQFHAKASLSVGVAALLPQLAAIILEQLALGILIEKGAEIFLAAVKSIVLRRIGPGLVQRGLVPGGEQIVAPAAPLQPEKLKGGGLQDPALQLRDRIDAGLAAPAQRHAVEPLPHLGNGIGVLVPIDRQRGAAQLPGGKGPVVAVGQDGLAVAEVKHRQRRKAGKILLHGLRLDGFQLALVEIELGDAQLRNGNFKGLHRQTLHYFIKIQPIL